MGFYDNNKKIKLLRLHIFRNFFNFFLIRYYISKVFKKYYLARVNKSRNFSHRFNDMF